MSIGCQASRQATTDGSAALDLGPVSLRGAAGPLIAGTMQVAHVGAGHTRPVTSPDPRTVTVERHIPAPADQIFSVLVSPELHADLDGSGMLQGSASGPGQLYLGARFTMAMRQGPFSYRSVNEVTECEENRARTMPETLRRLEGTVRHPMV